MTLHPKLDWPAVSWALGYYTRSDAYLAARFEGATRIDLVGDVADTVTAS